MRVVLTRPANEAIVWAQGLKSAGHEVVLLPLIVIGPTPFPERVAQFWGCLSQFQAVMFVSANAVAGFFAGRPLGQLPGKQSAQLWDFSRVRAWATGPGTVRALLAQGVPANAIDSPLPSSLQFDSESLWNQVSNRFSLEKKVLIVRGMNEGWHTVVASESNGSDGFGRDWLSQKLAQAGVVVEFCVAYQRARPVFAQEQLQSIRNWVNTGEIEHLIWLFSSSEAISNLADALPGQPWKQAKALCTHPRIAQRARACGFGVVWESRPTLEDVVASIELSP